MKTIFVFCLILFSSTFSFAMNDQENSDEDYDRGLFDHFIPAVDLEEEKCPVCSIMHHDLKNHLNVKHKRCDICLAGSFDNLEELLNHLAEVHEVRKIVVKFRRTRSQKS